MEFYPIADSSFHAIFPRGIFAIGHSNFGLYIEVCIKDRFNSNGYIAGILITCWNYAVKNDGITRVCSIIVITDHSASARGVGDNFIAELQSSSSNSIIFEQRCIVIILEVEWGITDKIDITPISLRTCVAGIYKAINPKSSSGGRGNAEGHRHIFGHILTMKVVIMDIGTYDVVLTILDRNFVCVPNIYRTSRIRTVVFACSDKIFLISVYAITN